MSTPDYPDWKAPKADGAVLLWPDPAEQLEIAGRGFAPPSDAMLGGLPMREVRDATRTFIGHNSNAPLVLTGHQTELHHPGVWIKNVVVHHLAARLGGRAVHLAVDTDQPKHLELRYLDAAVSPVRVPLTDDAGAASAEWSGLVGSPSPVHAAGLERAFTGHAPALESMLPEFLAEVRLASMDEQPLPKLMTAVLHKIDWQLGLRYDALLASPLWGSDGFLLLVQHLAEHAGRFAADYNAALAEYRASAGITTPGRPMPDLKVDRDAIELPFWLDDLAAGSRERLVVRRGASGFGLPLEGGPVGSGLEGVMELRRRLRLHNLRISPRAMTLTLFARLLLADLFVHGIGGGRYDQVTDLLIGKFFGIAPPPFSVATGTLYHPWSAGRQRACVECVKQEGHRLGHALLGADKRRYLSEIASAPRRSAARKTAFLAMHAALARRRASGTELTEFAKKLSASERAAEADKLVFDRELFYLVQPKRRLLEWIGSLAELIGKG
jgi:hypothetical protein